MKTFLPLFLLSFFISVVLELAIYDHKNIFSILSKLTTENYLTYEPFMVRGSFVNHFDRSCLKKECLPFKKKREKRNDLNEHLLNLEGRLTYIPLTSEKLFEEIRFKNIPVYLDIKTLGALYYSDIKFINSYSDRFNVAYKIDSCFGKLKYNLINNSHAQKKTNIMSKKIFNILLKYKKLENFNCKDENLLSLVKSLKQNGVKYIIEGPNFSNLIRSRICVKDICIYEI